MLNSLSIGQVGRLDWTVDASMVISLGGDPRATVFSTPNMILLMERAAREALRPYLPAGYESVGVVVNVEHLAGATLGSEVYGLARVTSIEGKRIGFDVEAWQGQRQIGRGSHTRAIVVLEKMIESVSKLSQPARDPSPFHSSVNASTMPTPPQLATVNLSVTGRIATLQLNRPNQLNAVSTQMTSDIEQAIAWLMAHPQEVRVVLMTGAGRAFCAGDDVKELEQLPIETARSLSLRQAEMYLAMERLPQPIIALVHGDAFGAGCVAAHSADLRISSHAARFAMPEIRLGWNPGYGLAQLTALVGKSRALQLCLLGEPVSARQALEWGLVSELVPQGNLVSRGLQIANKMLQMPPEALRQTKRAIHLDEGNQPKVAYRADTEAYIRCLQSDDAKEGMRAFAEKRAAKFRT